MSEQERNAFETWKRDVVLHGKSDMSEIDWHMAWLGWKWAIGFGNQLGSSYVSRLIDAISPPKSGEAIEHDITEYTITGSVKWLAQQARQELQAARAQAPASGEVEPVAEVRRFGFGKLRSTLHWLADPTKFPHGTKVYTHPPAAQAPASGEVEPVAWNDPAVDPIVSKLYRKFKEWSQRGFTADDVTWCEVRGYVAELMSARPPAKVPESLDVELIADILADYMHLQTSGEISGANRYAVSCVNEQIELITTHTSEAEWVKCEDHLPKVGQRVQLFSQGVIQNHMPIFDEDDEGLFWDFEIEDHNPRVDFERDQWRPTPTPPQEQ